MDYVLKKQPVNFTKDIIDTVSQQSVDLDFILPDYCADIEKILKTTLDVKIYSKNLSAGLLRIDGASVVRVLYCDSKKNALRCCEQTVPFSVSIPVSDEVYEHIILTKAKPEYINCRALTPRRLSIHGAFSLYTMIKEKCTVDISEASEDEALQTKVESGTICELCDFLQEQFSVSESVTVNTRNTVEAIIRSEIYVELKDTSIKGNKLCINAEATLKMLYICDAQTGEVDQFVYVFPFTENIDIRADSFQISQIQLDVMSCELMLSSGMVSQDPVVNIELKVSASYMSYQKREISYISDAYSVKDDVSLITANITQTADILPINVSKAIKSSINLGERKVSKILDIFCDSPSVSAEVCDKQLKTSGKLNVCVFALCEDGEIICVERRVDIQTEEVLEKDFESVRNHSLEISSISYRIADNNELSLRFDVKVSATLFDFTSITQVKNVEIAGEKSMGENAPLTLYYAQKDENIWDIAKNYQAPISLLRSENKLEEDVLHDNRMLMILNV